MIIVNHSSAISLYKRVHASIGFLNDWKKIAFCRYVMRTARALEAFLVLYTSYKRNEHVITLAGKMAPLQKTNFCSLNFNSQFFNLPIRKIVGECVMFLKVINVVQKLFWKEERMITRNLRNITTETLAANMATCKKVFSWEGTYLLISKLRPKSLSAWR